ncbi:hypothetical protein BY996DRAFT_7547727 [Phakopsora pachyrhizi]|nr:hypothetical protein BY996DRAFT_7547727 [Phakopsora pachyrhizi]
MMNKSNEKLENRCFRLHLGGLSETVREDEILKRLDRFGKVIKADGIHKLDGNGHPLKYGFVEIESTECKINQCMNLLSGTHFKGSVLRISIARPDYIARRNLSPIESKKTAEDDNQNLNTEDKGEGGLKSTDSVPSSISKLKKRKNKKRRVDGIDFTNDMDLMTLKRFKSRDRINGWKKDPATSLPIFPLITRPLRPIETFPSNDIKSSEGKNDQKKTACPPNRARRIKIDPTVYHSKLKNGKAHLLSTRAISIEQFKLGFSGGAKEKNKIRIDRKMWECETTGETGVVIWRLKEGSNVVHEEKIKLSSSTSRQLPVQSLDVKNVDKEANFHVIETCEVSKLTKNIVSSAFPGLQLDSERQSHLAIFQNLYPGQSMSDSCRLKSKSFKEHSSPKGSETQTPVSRFDCVAEDVQECKETSILECVCSGSTSCSSSDIKPYSPGNQINEAQATVLRLRGGGDAKLLSRKKSRKRKKTTDLDSETPSTCISQKQAEGDEKDLEKDPADEDIAIELKRERERYISLASQVVFERCDPLGALEDVGQGSREAVERQKVKELRHNINFGSEIEFVPPIDEAFYSKRNRKKNYWKRSKIKQPKMKGEVFYVEAERKDKKKAKRSIKTVEVKNLQDSKSKKLTEIFKPKESENVEFRLADVLNEIELDDETDVLNLKFMEERCEQKVEKSEKEEKNDDHGKNYNDELGLKTPRMHHLIHPSRISHESSWIRRDCGRLGEEDSANRSMSKRDTKDRGGIFGLLAELEQERDGNGNERNKELPCINSSEHDEFKALIQSTMNELKSNKNRSDANQSESDEIKYCRLRKFIRTETDEQIEEEHNSNKKQLTEQMRLKHKEHVKLQRRQQLQKK